MGMIGKVSRIFTNTTRSQWRAAQLEEIGRKMEMCSDSSVKAVADELVSSLAGGGGRSKASIKIINKAEHLLDSVNTAEGRYSTLFNENFPLGMYSSNVSGFSRRFYGWLGKSRNPLLKKFSSQMQRITHSVPRQVKDLAGSQEFETASRFSSMKRYISMYPEDKKMASQLWEKHYLSTLDADTSKFLREIDRDFGVKVFMDRPLRKGDLLFLREELANFHRASNGKAQFPPVLDLNNFAPELRDNSFAGICVNFKWDKINRLQGGRHIAVDTIEHAYNHKVLRHELAHYNDSKLKPTVIKEKLSPQEQREMIDAGITSPLSYAQKNSNEVKAVWAEGSMSKYSDAIKQKMIKKGLPEWITKLDDVSLEKYLLETFKDEKSLAALTEIRQAMGGKISNELSVDLLETPENLQKIRKILSIKDTHGEPVLAPFYKTALAAKPERMQIVEKFAGFEVKGAKPYCYDLGVFLAEENFSLEQVQKLYSKVEKAAKKGETFDLRAFCERYFPYRDRIKAQQRSQEIFGNVTNVTRRTFS
ncbi:MAG: hypothetical protein NC390_06850 [Fusobacterium sp.]|nr:hypothetical protein [Fusobacterium sp.]